MNNNKKIFIRTFLNQSAHQLGPLWKNLINKMNLNIRRSVFNSTSGWRLFFALSFWLLTRSEIYKAAGSGTVFVDCSNLPTTKLSTDDTELFMNDIPSSWFTYNKSVCFVKLDLSPVYPITCSKKNFSRFRRKSRRASCRIQYYPNSTVSFQLLLCAGDIELNPGPDSDADGPSTRQNCTQQRSSRLCSSTCSKCEKTVRRNQKRFVCDVCKDLMPVVSESLM